MLEAIISPILGDNNGGPLPLWAWLLGVLGVAAISAAGAIAAAILTRRQRRDSGRRFDELRADHDTVGSRLAELLGHLLHLTEKVDSLDTKLDNHLDHHRKHEADWSGLDRRTGNPDRRTGAGGPYPGPERRTGPTDRRDAAIDDL